MHGSKTRSDLGRILDGLMEAAVVSGEGGGIN